MLRAKHAEGSDKAAASFLLPAGSCSMPDLHFLANTWQGIKSPPLFELAREPVR
jgi:hypothetical protein